MKSIFVSIASYRDPQIIDTIENLLNNKSGNYKIIIGVCLQDDPHIFNNFKYNNHSDIKIKFVDYMESEGVSWARYIIQTELYDNEDYYFQIDSHSRVCENWDSILVKQLEECGIEKTIISTYPNAFNLNDTEKSYLKNTTTPYLKISRILPNNKIIAVSAGIVKEEFPILGFWVAAGFIFTYGSWVKDVPYNKDFYFSGEEDYISVKSFVEGYNVYIPPKTTLWHDYTDNRLESSFKYRPLHWEDHPGKEASALPLETIYNSEFKGSSNRSSFDFLDFAKKLSNFNGMVDVIIKLKTENLIPIDSRKIMVIVFAILDIQQNEIFRSDIYDEKIINRETDFLKKEIPQQIDNAAAYCIWWIKYEDHTFGVRNQLRIARDRDVYII